MEAQQELNSLFRTAVGCSVCFQDGTLQRSFIDIAHPRLIGADYWTATPRILVLMINPGQGSDDESHREQAKRIRAFGAGQAVLTEIFRTQRNDLGNWGKGRFLAFYCGSLGLHVDELAFANVAWCGTKGNQYPRRMLDECFRRHTAALVRLLAPNFILASGASVHPFKGLLEAVAPAARVICAPHYAHRNGGEYEEHEARRIRAELGMAGEGGPAPAGPAVHHSDSGGVVVPLPRGKAIAQPPVRRVGQFNPAARIVVLQREYPFKGMRAEIWGCMDDGLTVEEFSSRVKRLGPKYLNGAGDLKIYLEKGLIAIHDLK
jgi:hypothetical protein